ncbi:hypothetical protein GmHk_05G014575 [Glycine max]|nr:hypothetical protein GmHk_05G014575 [Glycine max]
MSFILWLVKRNRLLTLDKAAFLNKGFVCPLCSNEVESNARNLSKFGLTFVIWLLFADDTNSTRCAHLRPWSLESYMHKRSR